MRPPAVRAPAPAPAPGFAPARARGARPAAARWPGRAQARGFSLLVILIMTAVLALLGLGAMSSSIVQERMVGNARDRQVALQATEAALRDAEADIEANAAADSGFTDSCTDGLCIPPSDTANGAQSAPRWQTINWASQTRGYGSRTGAPALLGPDNQALAAQPRYFIERLPTLPPESGSSACVGGGCANNPADRARAYRITARGWGMRASTTVTLQSVYVKQ